MKNRATTILFHILAWIGFLSLPILIIPKPIVEPSKAGVPEIWLFLTLIVINLLLIGFYYVNYYVLIPKFLLTKKFVTYIGLNIMIVLSTFFMQTGLFPKPQSLLLKSSVLIGSMISVQILFMYLLVFFASIGLRLSKEWTDAQEKIRIAENERLKSELFSLKSQINPHFLFNTLNTIYSLSVQKSSETPEHLSIP